jgi:hypothetical protein
MTMNDEKITIKKEGRKMTNNNGNNGFLEKMDRIGDA